MTGIDKEEGQTFFLATTAIPECWETHKPLIFLGPWCMRFSQRASYENLGYQVLPDPWQDQQEKLKARAYIEDFHARLLPELTNILNTMHGQHHQQRFWEILLGSWLRIQLTVIYDRYTSLVRAYQSFPNLETIGLCEESLLVPTTNHEYADYLATDWYNLQIYSHILTYLNIPFAKKKININDLLTTDANKISFVLQLKKSISKLANNFFHLVGNKKNIVLIDSETSLTTFMQFFIRSKFSFLPITHFDWNPRARKIDEKNRAYFTQIKIAQSDFERCFIKLLPFYIPMVYVELYKDLQEHIESLKIRPKVIFSSFGWHYNEAFKYFAAYHQEQGSILCGHQHGGDYGILAYHPSEIHELKVTDRFYSWGWDDLEKHNVIPFNALKLRRQLNKKSSAVKGQILYGTANSYRYLFRFNFPVCLMMNYYDLQKKFLDALSHEVQQKLQIRLFHSDWGWDRKESWQTYKTRFYFQSNTIPFCNALDACDLYVADHISTTFIESLSVNKPTLIFYNPEMWMVRDQARSYFADLKHAGILYEDPLKAAEALNQLYPNINTWWFEPERQKLIKKFNARFCRAASTNLTEWLTEFSRLARSHSL